MNTSDNNNNNLVHQFASPQAPPSKDRTAFISPTTVFPDDTNVNAINTADCILNLPPNRTAYPAVNTIHNNNNNNNNTTVSAATTDVEMATQCILAGDILSPSVATTTSTVSSLAINTDNPTITTTTTNNNSIGDMDLGATTLICDALQYVLVHEGRAFRNLESLALSHGFVPTTGIMNETASQRLIRALITGRSSASYNDAVKKIETCLGKWVVHNYTYKYTPYCAKNNEAAVLTTTNNSNMLFDAWMANISDWAKGEKVRYKQVLDARKDALDGILGLERARLVNNQKSAHLSKFQSNLVEQGKTCLIQWLIQDKYYSTLINAAYFKQRIDK